MNIEFQAHYIALKTLRQRCEYLQQRLDAVEEENLKLKLEKSQGIFSKSIGNASTQKDQIALLNKHKSQLTHQIQMLTVENQNLWSQLSSLMSGNDKLGRELSVSSVSNNYQDLKYNQPPNSSNNNSLGCNICDYNKESLEEISLKLINGILMSKNELENQYSQMIDLQKESDPAEVKKFSFSSSQIGNMFASNSLKTYIQKLQEFKQVLHQQKNDLSDAIKSTKNYQKWCSENQKDASNHNNTNPSDSGKPVVNASESDPLAQSTGTTVNDEGSLNSEMICPICGLTFVGEFEDFSAHVHHHFDNESEESVHLSANFEVIP